MQDKTSEGSEFQPLTVSGKNDLWNYRVLARRLVGVVKSALVYVIMERIYVTDFVLRIL